MFLLVIVVVAAVGAAVTAIVVNVRDSDDKPTATTSVCDTREIAATELLACLSPSIAFIETSDGTGSGVLLDDKYVVTNAHVIDPYGAADVSFAGGEHHDNVPVVGVDLLRDIALLGPVATDRTGTSIATSESTAQGARVFLVGYPGETDKDPVPTISEGVLSRTRKDERFGLTFLQTDASIGGGQSGGALADAQGHVVGISGYSFAEQFALALDGADVITSIDWLRSGQSSPYRPVPELGNRTNQTVHLGPGLDQVIIVPSAVHGHDIYVTARGTPTPAIEVVDLYGSPLAINAEFITNLTGDFGLLDFVGLADNTMSVDEILDQAGYPAVDEGLPPGVIDIRIDSDVTAVIRLATTLDADQDVVVESNVPVVFAQQFTSRQKVKAGDHIDAVLDEFQVFRRYEIDLKAGQSIEVDLATANGTVGFLFVRPGQDAADSESVEGAESGPVGSEAKRTFTADETGLHTIWVATFARSATRFELDLREI